MKPVSRILLLAFAWAVSWAALGALLSAVVGIVDPDSIGPGEEPPRIAAILGSFGLVSGAVFGALVLLAEKGRDLFEVPLGRVALWGALASATVPLVAGKPDQLLPFCPWGALVALLSAVAGRLLEARRFPD